MTRTSFGFRVLKGLITAIFMPLYRLRSSGEARIPPEGAVVLAANHVSYWDAIFLQIACPRPIRWMIDEQYYRLPILHALFRWIGCIPVKEAGNRAALDTALAALKAGEVVGIFPEGFLSRTGRMGRPRTGVSTLTARSGGAAVPAYLRGAFFSWHKGQWFPRLTRVEVRFGDPLYLRRREDIDRVAMQRFAEELMEAIKGLYGHEKPRGIRAGDQPPPGARDGTERRGKP